MTKLDQLNPPIRKRASNARVVAGLFPFDATKFHLVNGPRALWNLGRHLTRDEYELKLKRQPT